jgi:hypothetical protein
MGFHSKRVPKAGIYLTSLLLLISNVSFGDAKRNQMILETITGLAVPSLTDLRFFRYGSHQERLRIGKTPPFEMDNVNFGNAIAGRGLYVAENPISSVAFVKDLTAEEGELVSIKVQKGTPVLDLVSPTTLSVLKSKGISVEEIYHLNPQPPFLVKYSAPVFSPGSSRFIGPDLLTMTKKDEMPSDLSASANSPIIAKI